MAIFASIKKVTEKDNYSLVRIQIMTKNKKRENKREPSFIGEVKFVWEAHLCKPQVGQFIKIEEFIPSNCYVNNDGEIKFLQNTMLTVMKYELQADNGSKPNSADLPKLDLTDVENQLPF